MPQKEASELSQAVYVIDNEDIESSATELDEHTVKVDGPMYLHDPESQRFVNCYDILDMCAFSHSKEMDHSQESLRAYERYGDLSDKILEVLASGKLRISLLLNSNGGNVFASEQVEQMINYVRAKGGLVDAYVTQRALSAAAELFMKADDRFIHKNGGVGFHSASMKGDLLSAIESAEFFEQYIQRRCDEIGEITDYLRGSIDQNDPRKRVILERRIKKAYARYEHDTQELHELVRMLKDSMGEIFSEARQRQLLAKGDMMIQIEASALSQIGLAQKHFTVWGLRRTFQYRTGLVVKKFHDDDECGQKVNEFF